MKLLINLLLSFISLLNLQDPAFDFKNDFLEDRKIMNSRKHVWSTNLYKKATDKFIVFTNLDLSSYEFTTSKYGNSVIKKWTNSKKRIKEVYQIATSIHIDSSYSYVVPGELEYAEGWGIKNRHGHIDTTFNFHTYVFKGTKTLSYINERNHGLLKYCIDEREEEIVLLEYLVGLDKAFEKTESEINYILDKK